MNREEEDAANPKSGIEEQKRTEEEQHRVCHKKNL
jgi:hypothetical protein